MPLKNTYKECIQIHYQRDDCNYKSWALWLWEFPQGNGKEYHFDGVDEYGVFINIPLSNWSPLVKKNNLGLIIKSKGGWYAKDGSDRFIKFNRLSHDKFGIYHIYLKDGLNDVFDNEELEKSNIVNYVRFTDWRNIEVKTSDTFHQLKIYKNDELIDTVYFDSLTKFATHEISEEDISLDDLYEVEICFYENKKTVREPVTHSLLYRTKEFEEKYEYNGDLGAIFTKKATTFKVWSPVSKEILVRIYRNGTPKYLLGKKGMDKPMIEVPMVKDEHGVFSVTIKKNLAGKYYTYVVTNALNNQSEIVDPYAKSAGVDGLRGMIVNFNNANPLGFNDIEINPVDPKHLTVYETHICDLTSSKTWTQNKKFRKLEKTFLGACLEGTTYEENGKTVSTGFDHIKELGVNAVELLPIFDQANDEIHPSFNWGYNPINYNVLEGSYSTNPFNGYTRIFEFKTLVKKYHDAGINVIMDVVFNHMNGAPGSNFDVLMPGYYFRYHHDGTLSNGSGCGNETASELPMMRKFMIDSVMFFAKEYKLGGFRFDLMGLHDLKTMEELAKNLHDFNKNIVIFGEPWCGGGSALPYKLSCNQGNIPEFKGYGAFNDKIRETLVHLACEPSCSGWAGNSKSLPDEGETEQVVAAIKGTISGMGEGFDDPNTQVNYVTCHDNHTMHDKLVACNFKDEAEIKKVSMLAHSVIFTSNGISFMLAGEEFLRSKGGNENSYNAPYEVNALDYSLKIKNNDMFTNFKKLINFKQSVYELALEKGLNTLLDVKSSSGNVISYQVADKDTNRIYKVFHVNGYRNGGAHLVDLSGYKLYLDTINSHKSLGAKTSLVPYETLICYKEKENE